MCSLWGRLRGPIAIARAHRATRARWVHGAIVGLADRAAMSPREPRHALFRRRTLGNTTRNTTCPCDNHFAARRVRWLTSQTTPWLEGRQRLKGLDSWSCLPWNRCGNLTVFKKPNNYIIKLGNKNKTQSLTCCALNSFDLIAVTPTPSANRLVILRVPITKTLRNVSGQINPMSNGAVTVPNKTHNVVMSKNGKRSVGLSTKIH